VPLTGATLRVARSTERLDEVTTFYVDGLGLQKLAAFEDHAGFDGVVLGARQAPYHLEFTRQRGRRSGASPDPYWDRSGLTFEDPDGFRVVLQNSAWPL